jgi:hypothetical protein
MTSDLFRSIEDYELFLYTLADQYPSVARSTLALVRIGISMGKVSGEVYFHNGIHLSVRERLLFDRLPFIIDAYGYEIWRGEDKLFWYDSQPHPNDPSLQSTHPHHKHIQPDLKHHRIPASGMSFSQPNLPALIEEIEKLG